MLFATDMDTRIHMEILNEHSSRGGYNYMLFSKKNPCGLPGGRLYEDKIINFKLFGKS